MRKSIPLPAAISIENCQTAALSQDLAHLVVGQGSPWGAAFDGVAEQSDAGGDALAPRDGLFA